MFVKKIWGIWDMTAATYYTGNYAAHANTARRNRVSGTGRNRRKKTLKWENILSMLILAAIIIITLTFAFSVHITAAVPEQISGQSAEQISAQITEQAAEPAAAQIAEPSAERSKYYTCITVKSGDTLWGYAQEYATSEYNDYYTYIYEVQQLNKLSDSNLKPGMRLCIPYYAENPLV